MKAIKEERGWLDIIRFNKAIETLGLVKEIRKEWKILGWRLIFEWRSKKNLWGRFGGGWNWEVGFQLGSTTLILNCLIFKIMIISPQF